MSTFTNFVNGVGVDKVPVQTASPPSGSVSLNPHDYFLVSRVDGQSTLRALRSVSGMGEAEFCEAMVKVVAAGLVSIPGVEQRAALEVYAASLAGASAPAPPETRGPSASWSVPPAPRAEPTPVPARPRGTDRSGEFDRTSSAPAPPVDPRRPPAAVRSREVFETGSRPAAPMTKVQAPKLGLEIVPDHWPIPFNQFTFDPAVMASGDALDDEQKQVVLYFHYHLRRVTYYALFGLTDKASRTDVKLAYFRLSKTFHPDRWYRKDTGEFGEMIEDVFKWLNRAYGVLSSPKKRKGYDKLLQHGYIGEWQLDKSTAPATDPRAQTVRPAARSVETSPRVAVVDADARRTASMLAAKARHAEAAGQWAEACDLYERIVQVAPTPDLRIRLVECMLKANVNPQEIGPHVQAARESGADDKAVFLVEAEVARRSGQPDRAEACFRHVLEIEPNNPVARLGLERLGVSLGSKR